MQNPENTRPASHTALPGPSSAVVPRGGRRQKHVFTPVRGYHSPRRSYASLDAVVEEIVCYMTEDSRAHYTVIIGTDSQGYLIVDFVTAIVVHRVGRGGRYFWQRSHQGPIQSIRHKLYTETALSLGVAETFVSLLKESVARHPGVAYDFEIHVDAGENGPTREVLREVIGMVRGYGFTVRTKPDSYCASSVADRYA